MPVIGHNHKCPQGYFHVLHTKSQRSDNYMRGICVEQHWTSWLKTLCDKPCAGSCHLAVQPQMVAVGFLSHKSYPTRGASMPRCRRIAARRRLPHWAASPHGGGSHIVGSIAARRRLPHWAASPHGGGSHIGQNRRTEAAPTLGSIAARRRLPFFACRDPHDLASWVNKIERNATAAPLNLCVHRGKLGGAPARDCRRIRGTEAALALGQQNESGGRRHGSIFSSPLRAAACAGAVRSIGATGASAASMKRPS